eukprot:550125_1
MSLNQESSVEEVSFLSNNKVSKLPKSIYSLWLGLQFKHAPINKVLNISINLFALLCIVTQIALSGILLYVGAYKTIDDYKNNIKLFGKTPALTFTQKLLLFNFGILVSLIFVLRHSAKWRIFHEICKLQNSMFIKVLSLGPDVTDLFAYPAFIMLMLVSMQWSDILCAVIVLWFILSVDEYCYDTLLILCPDNVIEALLISDKINQICQKELYSLYYFLQWICDIFIYSIINY